MSRACAWCGAAIAERIGEAGRQPRGVCHGCLALSADDSPRWWVGVAGAFGIAIAFVFLMCGVRALLEAIARL